MLYPVNSGSVVSIPAGFSDALRHLIVYAYDADHSVSIPAGFSDALRRDKPFYSLYVR